MIFGYLELEGIVQTNDKTRLSAVKSYSSKDEADITLVRIKPDSTSSFVEVSGVGLSSRDWFLDWQYTTAGTKTVTLEITTDGSPALFTSDIEIVTPEVDYLFSSDKDLISNEPDILKWVPAGRNSFLNVHRAAQGFILDWLDNIRLHKKDGSRLEKEDILVTQDVKQLSTYWVLHLIFAGISNKTDDVFSDKAKTYLGKVSEVKNRGRIQLDLDGNNEITENERVDLRSFTMVRR